MPNVNETNVTVADVENSQAFQDTANATAEMTRAVAKGASIEILDRLTKHTAETADVLSKVVAEVKQLRESKARVEVNQEIDEVLDTLTSKGTNTLTANEFLLVRKQMTDQYGEMGAYAVDTWAPDTRIKSLTRQAEKASSDYDYVKQLQEAQDLIMLVSSIRGAKNLGDQTSEGKNRPLAHSDFNIVKETIMQLAEIAPCVKAYMRDIELRMKNSFDTITATQGAEWIPTTMSNQVVEMFRAEQPLYDLFRSFTYSTKTFEVPIGQGVNSAFFRPETITAADAANIPSSLMSNDTTGKVTLASKRMVDVRAYSFEFDEDAIPYTEMLLRSMGYSLRFAWEIAGISGSTSLTDLDNAAVVKAWTTTTDPRFAWDGLRKYVRTQTAAGTTSHVDGGNAYTNILNKMRAARALMGEGAAQNMSNFAWLGPVAAFMSILSDPNVQTIDKFGQSATVITGQIARLDGIPLVEISSYPTNLNTSGVFDNTTTNRTSMLLVNREAFAAGYRSTPEILREVFNLSFTEFLILSLRGDFIKTAFPSYPGVVELRNLPSAVPLS